MASDITHTLHTLILPPELANWGSFKTQAGSTKTHRDFSLTCPGIGTEIGIVVRLRAQGSVLGKERNESSPRHQISHLVQKPSKERSRAGDDPSSAISRECHSNWINAPQTAPLSHLNKHHNIKCPFFKMQISGHVLNDTFCAATEPATPFNHLNMMIKM